MIFDFVSKFKPRFKAEPQNSSWRPSYLQRKILLLFVITFAATIGALEACYQSSETQNGLATSSHSRHYLWTYGPTAIFTIVTTFWSRVEFQIKQNAPWQTMTDTPQPAGKSVLLDYISDMQPVALWRAARNKHFAVATSVGCSLLLQLIIIFSTSLFSLQRVQIHQTDVPIQLHNMFTTQDSTLDTVGSQPFDVLNGVIYDNVTYPIGTTQNLTFQDFSASNLSSSAIITVSLDGLRADLDCESATLDLGSFDYFTAENGGPVDGGSTLVDIYTSSCKISNASLVAIGAGTTALFNGGQCNSASDRGSTRVVLTIADTYEKNVTHIKSSNSSLENNATGLRRIQLGLSRSISYICMPTLFHLNIEAQRNASSSSSDTRLQTIKSQPTDFQGLTATDVAKFIVDNSTETTGFRPVDDTTSFADGAVVSSALTLGMHLIGVNVSDVTLWEDDMLQTSASAYYQAMTAQLLHMGLAKTNKSTTIGSAILPENRVKMLQLPLRGMEACLAICILLALCTLYFVNGEAFFTGNPAHISSIAAITANSEDFRSSLRGAGALSNKVLQSRLAGKSYFLRSTPRGTLIDIAENGRRESILDHDSGSKYVPWKAFPTFVSRIVIFLLVSSTIATLEVLLHFSQVDDGLGNASSTNMFMQYLWSLIPALIMSGISFLFGIMSFNIRCLAPYASLYRPNGATFEQSMNLSYLDSLGFKTHLRSLRSGDIAVQVMTLATGASFFLTIIVSGLYSATEVPYQIAVNFTRIGGFPDPRTIAGAQLDFDEQGEVAGILTSEYILQYNYSYPRWSYEELAFAEVSMNEIKGKGNFNGSHVDIRIPALRATLSCQLRTAADLKPNITYSNNGTSDFYQLSIDQLTLACPGNYTDYHYTKTIFNVEELHHQPFGYSVEAQCNANYITGNVLTGASHYTASYLWGYLNGSSIQHIRGMSCLQYAETVDVLTRFKLPELEVDEEHPPVPDESSAKLARNLYTPIPEWWVLNSNSQYPTLDGFFQLLVAGRYGIPVENFKSAEYDEAVIKEIKHQHKIISAQQFNNYTRSTANDTVKHAPIIGNVTDSSRQRVVQDASSTRILEALLASMLILGILASVLLNTDHVLPKNPCSIAAVASLLADSKLLDEYLRGEWSPNDKYLIKSFVHRRFHLGWWQESSSMSTNTNKIFTIDHKSTDKVA
ncbi:hypothetical protein N7462_003630 [Penicillium macrosclerotiorum]|uniref:uncharacterized protein n=1 Tax=Penicillium macrosclerotiorum TaxID=303699 RepID=UPI00254853B0|nr:uncharacterized protein N7462_003630 [Penicillium macrosclerotiorum]KAJ5689238.1 hypothetical protein N7462_003630 [Penicillium macrosclerotiorum]